MDINIIKKEDGNVYFNLNDIDREFNYEGLDIFIETFYDNENEVNIKCDDELNEYKKLLENILIECRKDDFVKAVKEAIKTQKEMDALEESITDEELGIAWLSNVYCQFLMT